MSTSTCRTAAVRRLQHTMNESLGLLRVKHKSILSLEQRKSEVAIKHQ